LFRPLPPLNSALKVTTQFANGFLNLFWRCGPLDATIDDGEGIEERLTLGLVEHREALNDVVRAHT
jgi:hypothetical protein